MSKIFISYRRDDEPFAAVQIHDKLVARYGAESVFYDVDSIPPGRDFVEVLDKAVSGSNVLVAVIGPRWLDLLEQKAKAGQPDFVRVEIESALNRKIPLMPVLVGKAHMPEMELLPKSLQPLTRIQAAEVRPDWTYAPSLQRLADQLNQWIDPDAPRDGQMTNALGMKFAWVPPGTSWLGGGASKPGQTRFVLPHGLWCGIYPVTREEWSKVYESDLFDGILDQAVIAGILKLAPDKVPSLKCPRFPVVSQSSERTQEFIAKVNELCTEDGLTYRLPTSWEWEYICRGGDITQEQSAFHFYFARSADDLTPEPSNELSISQANIRGEDQAIGSGGLRDVGSYPPNPLGIYDLHGNVWERTTSDDRKTDVLRGGSWYDDWLECIAKSVEGEFNGLLAPSKECIGFRLVADPSEE